MKKPYVLIYDDTASTGPSTSDFDLVTHAQYVYGYAPLHGCEDRFRNLYQNRYFAAALQRCNSDNRDLFERCASQIKRADLALMSTFEILLNFAQLRVYLFAEIIARHPDTNIYIHSRERLVEKLLRPLIDDSNNRVTVRFKRLPGISIDALFSWLLPRTRLGLLALNIAALSAFLLKFVVFKLKNPGIRKETCDILFVSDRFALWRQNDAGQKADMYFDRLYRQLKAAGLDVAITVNDTQSGTDSLYHRIALVTLVSCYLRALRRLIPLVFQLPKQLIASERMLFYRLYLHEFYRCSLATFNAKAVVYYSEAYLSGRVKALALHDLGIPAIGFQHAFNSACHPVYNFFSLKAIASQPDRLLIYGDVSERLFQAAGMAPKKMIKIGFDRHAQVAAQTITQQRRVLFIGQTYWFNQLFCQLYQQRHTFDLGQLYYRPHPAWRDDLDTLQSRCPEAHFLENDTLDHDIAQVDIVIGGYSTSLINAVYQQRVVISWLPYGMVPLLDFRPFGVQCIRSLEAINWQKPADPALLACEFTAQVDVVQTFKDWMQAPPNH